MKKVADYADWTGYLSSKSYTVQQHKRAVRLGTVTLSRVRSLCVY